MTTQQPEFGQRIRRRRLELGLSQRRVAGDVITSSYVSLLEAGRRAPTLDVLVHLSEVLRMPLAQLVGGDAPDGSAKVAPPRATAVTGDGPTHRRGRARLGQPDPGPPADASVAGRATAADLAPAADLVSADGLVSADDVVSAAGELLTPPMAVAGALETHDVVGAADKQAALLSRTSHPLRRMEVGLQLQGLLRACGRHTERVALLADLLSEEAAGVISLRVVLLTAYASAQRDAGRVAEARDTAATALALVEPSGLKGTAHHVQLLGVLISTLCELDELTAVPALLETMLRYGARLNIAELLCRARWIAAMAWSHVGEHDRAREQLLIADKLQAPTLSVGDWLRFCRSATKILIAAGRLDEARQWLSKAESLTAVVESSGEPAQLRLLQAGYKAASGDAAGALALYDSLVAAASTLAAPELAHIQMLRADLLERLDRRTEAAEALRDAAARYEEHGLFRLSLRAWRRIEQLRLAGRA